MENFSNYSKDERNDYKVSAPESGVFTGEKTLENAGAASRQLMTKVYGWMCAALAITAVTAMLCSSSQSLMEMIFGTNIFFWGLLIVEFGLVVAISGMIDRLSLSTATLLFILYSVVNGLTLSVIFVAYTQSSIASTFFITAGMFGATALYGAVTKKDLSGWGSFLFMALIGLIIAGVVNIFWQNSVFDFIVSAIGVLIFVGLTAYDSQAIKNMLAEADDSGSELFQKVALLGSLKLYLDFVNMFLYLLRFFGNRR